jgi:MSHA pilin protein MshD
MSARSLRRVRRSRGFTLVELLIVIVVAGVAVAAIGALIATTVRDSADPVIQSQGVLIAESYLEEALLKAYDNPDGVIGPCGASRDLWDSVLDYACLSTATVSDQQGNTLAGLASYRVTVNVSDSAVGGTPVRRVGVQVTHQDGTIDLTIAGYRANL